MSMNCRAGAALALLDVVDKRKSLTPVLVRYAEKIPANDKGLLQHICYGSCRHFFSLNALSKMMLEHPLPADARPVQALMWVGLYQLAYSDISEHAAIHETVEACGQLKQDKYRGLLNAVLRRFQREKSELLTGLQGSDVPHYQHPKWFIKLLKKSWPQRWQEICEQANIQAPMCLRVNTHKGPVSDYLQLLADTGIKATAGKVSPSALYLDKPMDVFALPNFEQGSCSVQDEAAQLAAQLLNPQPGEKVLDACSAPGGKTCHLLEHASGQLALTAMDADALRLNRVHENLARLGFSANTLVGEAQHPEQWWDGEAFDRILLDVPCSATGVIRRHPDIKLLRQKQDIDNLAQLQLAILQQAWQMLKAGGSLLYATCSILPQENAHNIAAFLSTQTDASLQNIELPSGEDTGYGWQLFPNAHSHDGFFYALLKKV
ncbi:MAG: 16S rRNA (cytosine(967)-C(5))-methyltransferase RsmB [Bermanella sp.]